MEEEDQIREPVKPTAMPEAQDHVVEEHRPPSPEATSFRARSRRALNNMTLQMVSILEPGEKKEAKENVLVGNSLCLFDPENSIRIACKKLVAHKYFDPFILVMIVFSTVLLTLENPLDDPDGRKADVLRVFDFVVSFIFVAEFLLKVLVFGFAFNGKESYIRSTWNQIDFMIVVFSVSKTIVIFFRWFRFLLQESNLALSRRSESCVFFALCE